MKTCLPLPEVPRRPVVVDLAIPCRDAADRFIVAHLPLAARVAVHFAHDEDRWAECFQEAALGLVDLVRRLLPELECASPAHAEALVIVALRHQIVLMLVRHVALAPSLTDFGVRRWVQVQRARQVLARRLGRAPTVEELAAALGIMPAVVRDLLAVATRPGSLEALAAAGLDVAAPTDAPTQREAARLRRAVARLAQPERFIVQAQFGIGMGRLSVAHLAQILDLPPRRVIAHRHHALALLRVLLSDD